MLVARGRLLHLPHAARLHLYAWPEVPAPVPRARPGYGLRRASGRDHQHEGRARPRGRPIRGMAAAGCRELLLPPTDPAGVVAAGSDPLRPSPALLLGEISGPDRGKPARARRRAAGAAGDGPTRSDLSRRAWPCRADLSSPPAAL